MNKIHANDVYFVQDKQAKTFEFLYRDKKQNKYFDLDGKEVLIEGMSPTKQLVKLWDHIEITKHGRKARMFGFLQWGTSSFNFPMKAIRYFYFGAKMNISAMIEFNAWPIKEITNKHYRVENLKKVGQYLTKTYAAQSQGVEK